MRLTQVIIFFALLGVIVLLFQEQFIALVFWITGLIGEKFPILKPPIDFITQHVLAVDLIGLFLVMFLGRNPLIPLPLEPYLILAYAKIGNFWAVWLVASIGIALAASVTYFVGYIVGKRFIEFLFKEKVEHSVWFDKYTGIFAFLAAILPFPEILSIIFGVHRSNFKHFFLGTLLGTLIKFAIVLLLFDYFEAQVYSFFEPYLETMPFIKALFHK